jgi:hypothetical protein
MARSCGEAAWVDALPQERCLPLLDALGAPLDGGKDSGGTA